MTIETFDTIIIGAGLSGIYAGSLRVETPSGMTEFISPERKRPFKTADTWKAPLRQLNRRSWVIENLIFSLTHRSF